MKLTNDTNDNVPMYDAVPDGIFFSPGTILEFPPNSPLLAKMRGAPVELYTEEESSNETDKGE